MAYTIQSGDTLSGIAKKQGTTVADLMKANPTIKDPNLIYAGASLNLPTTSVASKYIQDPNNPNASIPNPDYKAPVVSPTPTPISPVTPTVATTTPITPVVAPTAITPNAAAIEQINKELADFQASQNVVDPEEIPVRASQKALTELVENAPKAPEPIDSVATLAALQEKYETDELEVSITNIDKTIADLENEYREKSGEERLISVGFRNAENRALASSIQAKIDALNREKDTFSAQLSNKYNAINTILSLQKSDFETASKSYSDAYNRQVNLIGLLQGQEQIEATQTDKLKTSALATWNILNDSIGEAIKSGSISSYDSLPTSTKLNLSKLEMQAGMPMGMTQQILSTIRPDEKILTTQMSYDQTQASVIIQKSDGTFRVQTIGTGLTPEPTITETTITSAGGIQPITTLSGKPLTDTQALSLGYAQRMNDAHLIITELGDKMIGVSSYISGSKYFPNIWKSEDRQKYEQAERNFINAVLRKESGAAISPSEFDSATKQYFPVAGDKQAVIDQKTANRLRAIANLSQAANVSLQSVIGAQNQSGGSYENYLNAIK
jgi:molybdopterin converting factor small subunit